METQDSLLLGELVHIMVMILMIMRFRRKPSNEAGKCKPSRCAVRKCNQYDVKEKWVEHTPYGSCGLLVVGSTLT